MNPCPEKEKCFLMSGVNLMPVLRRTIVNYYCEKNFVKCARYELKQLGQPVPENLLPTGKLYITPGICK
ncbi:MAG: hypothetical protein CVV03_11515 [Firmicutes bacterium HGW-Firmicutes-8]|nr:MAG: hypothetical protein CVV03_11515 [Firmicutes bacterium HGW-Firmicutes-8]